MRSYRSRRQNRKSNKKNRVRGGDTEGDERCGKDFDTILIEGKIDKAKNRRNYVLAGSTATGFIIQYEYNISITN
jgi:hypothetical protein